MVLKKPSIKLFGTVVFLLILSVSNVISYVYEAQTLYNTLLHQQIILLSDYHEDSPASTEQRLAILDKAKKDGACLLVEDQAFLFQHLSATDIIAYQPCLQQLIDDLVEDPVTFDPNKQYQQDFSILDPASEGDTTPLFLLTHMARHANIKAYTVECRQAEVISSKGGPITAATVCQVYDKEVEHVAQYNDGPVYNAYYRNKLNNYKTYAALAQKFFTYLHSCEDTLMQAYNNRNFEQCALKSYTRMQQDKPNSPYCQLEFDPDDDIYEKLMCSIYLWLIDTSIIHQIAQQKTAPVIIVYAGGAHIDEIIPVLHSHGYESMSQSGGHDATALDLEAYFEQSTIFPTPTVYASEETYTQSSLLLALATAEEPLTTSPHETSYCFENNYALNNSLQKLPHV